MTTTSRLHIAHLTTHHGPGDPRMVLKQAASSVAEGHAVTVMLPKGNWGLPAPASPELASEASGGNAIQWHWLQSAYHGRRLDRLWRIRREVIRAVDVLKPDLLHVHDPALLPAVPYLRTLGHHIVYDMHDLVPLQVLRKHWIPKPLRSTVSRIWAVLERHWLRGLPVIFAEDAYRQHYPGVGLSTVIHNFVDYHYVSRFRSPPAPTPTLAYLGGVGKDRGLDTTLEAIGHLGAQGLEVEWDCIGPVSPGGAATLEAWRRKNPHVQVRDHGALPQETAMGIVARAHIGLALLQAIPNYLTSYPTKLFEYMALGIPVIASDFPLYRDVVEGTNCGLCVNPDDPEALANAIRHLVTQPDDAQAMGEAGRDAVRRLYCWESESERLHSFYEKILRS